MTLPLNMYVSARLKQERIQSGLSRGAISSLISSTPQSLYRMESGITKPSLEVLYAYAKACNLSLEDLLPEVERVYSSPMGLAITLERFERDLLKSFEVKV